MHMYKSVYQVILHLAPSLQARHLIPGFLLHHHRRRHHHQNLLRRGMQTPSYYGNKK
jgi:hypothetical protein